MRTTFEPFRKKILKGSLAIKLSESFSNKLFSAAEFFH